MQNTIKETKYLKETKYIEALENIKESDQVSEKFKRILDLNRDKGSGAWLIALPIQSLGYSLNKQEFQDSVCLRYGWNIINAPNHCQCGKENEIDHSLNSTYLNKSSQQVFEMHQSEKKRSYLERVLQVKKGLFTPIVFSTFGGSGEEALRIAELLADKKNKRYEEIVSHMKTRLCFSLLRSILLAVWGVRGRHRSQEPVSMVEFSYDWRGHEIVNVKNWILYCTCAIFPSINWPWLYTCEAILIKKVAKSTCEIWILKISLYHVQKQ